MKRKNLLSRELELFFRDIQPKREQIAKKKKNETSNRFRISTKCDQKIQQKIQH